MRLRGQQMQRHVALSGSSLAGGSSSSGGLARYSTALAGSSLHARTAQNLSMLIDDQLSSPHGAR